MKVVDKKPRGLLRALLRVPIPLFKCRFGWLLGGRFLMLTTIGRRSGQARFAVVEVVKRKCKTRQYIIASGWGTKSDWYQNIQKTPLVKVDIGIRRFDAHAETLEVDHAEEVLLDYATRHPSAFRQLTRLMIGGTYSDTRELCVHLARMMPLVKLIPVGEV